MTFVSSLDRLLTVRNPYPGLRPFEPSEGFLYFGREEQVAALVERLGRHRFIGIVGVSGSGKSSLVLAGLIPALRRGVVAGSRGQWREVIMRPGAAPFERLAAALTEAGLAPGNLRRSSFGLVRAAEALDEDENLLLVVDQFEELFRYKDAHALTPHAAANQDRAAAEASDFVQLLLTATGEAPPIYVVLTIRSEYLGDCAEFPDLPEALNASRSLIPRLTREGRKAAIEGPLGGAKTMDAVAVQRILNDAGEEPSDLPLLQHVLMRTWSRWHDVDPDRTRAIAVKDYEDVGAFADALNRHANQLLESPIAKAHPDIPERIFRRLTARGPSQRERRDPTLLKDLWAVCGAETAARRDAVTAIVELFRRDDATFLMPRDGKLKSDTYIDITHESLIRKWGLLATLWFPSEQRQATQLRELHARALAWEKQRGEVLHGRDLDEAEQWERSRNQTAAWARHHLDGQDPGVIERLLDASREERTRRSRREAFLRWSLVFTLGIALLAIGFYALGVRQQEGEARAARLVAQAKLLERTEPAKLDVSLRLALESLTLSTSGEADRLVRQYGGLLGVPIATLDHATSSPIWAVAIGGSRVATLPDGPELHLWDLESGEKLATVKEAARINAFRFSADARLMATASANGDVAVWDITSGAPTEQARLHHPESVNDVAFSPDARLLATAADDGGVRVWDLDARKEIERFAHGASAQHVAFGPQRLLASSGDDGNVQVWRLRERPADPAARRVAIFSAREPLASLALIASGGFPLDSFVDVHTGRRLESDAVDAPGSAASGAVVVAGDYGGGLRLWLLSPEASHRLRMPSPVAIDCVGENGLTIGQLLQQMKNPGAGVSLSLGGVPNRRERAVLGCGNWMSLRDNGVARLWVASDRSWVTQSDTNEQARFLHVVPEPTALLSASIAGNRAVIGDASGRARIWQFDPDGGPAGSVRTNVIAVSPDGRRLASWDREGLSWREGQAGARQMLGASAVRPTLVRAAFDRSGQQLAVATLDGGLAVWDLTRNATITTTPLGFGPMDLVLEQSIALVRGASTAVVVDTKTGARTQLGAVIGAYYGGGAALSSDGRTVATWESDGGLSLWSTRGDNAIRVNRSDVQVHTAAFDPRSGALAVCQARDQRLRFLDPSTGKDLRAVDLRAPCQVLAIANPSGRIVVAGGTAISHVDGNNATILLNLDEVLALRFSPDGRSLAAVTQPGLRAVHVIDVDSGKVRAHIPPADLRDDSAMDAAFSHDAAWLFTSDWTHPLEKQRLIEAACRRLTRDLTENERAEYFGGEASGLVACVPASAR